jgi:hypothetical protein
VTDREQRPQPPRPGPVADPAHPPMQPPLDLTGDDEEPRPSLLKMMGLVAISVALVILVFFGIGFLFGRAFL